MKFNACLALLAATAFAEVPEDGSLPCQDPCNIKCEVYDPEAVCDDCDCAAIEGRLT